MPDSLAHRQLMSTKQVPFILCCFLRAAFLVLLRPHPRPEAGAPKTEPETGLHPKAGPEAGKTEPETGPEPEAGGTQMDCVCAN